MPRKIDPNVPRRPRGRPPKNRATIPAPLPDPASLAQKRNEKGQFENGSVQPYRHTAAAKLNATVSAMVREIGMEVVEGSPGWTRLEVIVRSMFSDAIAGDNRAREMLLERGWGKVPTPVEVDVRGAFLTISRDMNLTKDDIDSDPVLAILAQQNGVVVDTLPPAKLHEEQYDSAKTA